MSTFKVEVVPVSLTPHPNADSLSIVKVYDFPVIVRTEDWQDRTSGAYIPVDGVVPNTEDYDFLQGHLRIRAKKLRGIFSMGLLVPTPEGAAIGDDVTERLMVTKYEPPEPMITGGDTAPPPPVEVPGYTDIEHLRRYAHVFQEGEQVIVTEKIHGANARYFFHEGVLHVGSHHQWKKEDPASAWWKVVTPDLRYALSLIGQNKVIFGEVYGAVQDLKYGLGPGKVSLRVFDVFDLNQGKYLDWDDLCTFTSQLEGFTGFPMSAPVIFASYLDQWDRPFNLDQIVALAEQDSLLAPGQIMEGIVVRPLVERYNDEIGRVILKLHSQRYLLRKE